MNSIYIQIPKAKSKLFLDEIELGFIKPYVLKADSKNNIFAEFRFSEDITDIRVRYLLYASLVLHFGLGKKTLKAFNRIDDIYFGAMDFEEIKKFDSIIDIVELIETSTLFKDVRTINNFCSMTKIARLNGHPAVLKISKETSGGLYHSIMSRANTWASLDKISDDFVAIAFTISAEEFDIETQAEVENIEAKIEDENSDNLRLQRLQNKCSLLENFINMSEDNIFWEDITLKFLLSRFIKICGGQAFFKKQIKNMNLPADTVKMLEYMTKIYKAKNTYFKCSEKNCPHYHSCQNKKMYSTTELLFDRYEPVKPINLLSVSEAKTELSFMVQDAMETELRFNDMAIIKVPTSLGKTTAYTNWVIDSLKDSSLRKINIIAVPTVKLAIQVKEDIQALLKANNLSLNIYSVEELTPILEELNIELLEDYEKYNKLGAYTRASRLIHEEVKRIAKKYQATEDITIAEKKLVAFSENKKKVSALSEQDALYIVTHEWLSFQKDTSKLSGKTIIIDEDIFSSLNKVNSLKIRELLIIEHSLEQKLAKASAKQAVIIKEAVKLMRNMRIHFDEELVDFKIADIPHFQKKEHNFDITVIAGTKKVNLTDILVDEIIENNIESNILAFFESEYYIKYNDEIIYNIRRDLYIDRSNNNINGTKYIMFSATADEKVYRQLFSSRQKTSSMNIKFYDMGPVESKGQTLQFTNITASKSQLNTVNDDGVRNIHNILEDVKSLGLEDALLLTYKEFADEQKRYIEKYGHNKYDMEIVENMYLGNTAGYNDLIGRNLVILGSLRAPEHITFLIAKSLGIDLSNSGNLKYRVVEYGYYRFKFYCYENNEDLNHLMMWLIDKENIQAAGRNRNRWNNATTVIISPIPNPEATLIDSKVDIKRPNYRKNIAGDSMTQDELDDVLADILSSIE